MSKENQMVVQINTVCNNSTGRIMHDIQQTASDEGYETMSFVGRRRVYRDLPCEKFGNGFSFWIHVGLNTIFDRQGHGSFLQTRKLVKKLRILQPDIIHLHNLHGYYLHIPTLFNYLLHEYTGRIYWTFHDLWPITGHCPYYNIVECEKWKTQCYQCPNKREYPISWVLDSSKRNYVEKKEIFSRIENLHIVVPSMWMKEQVQQSFLKDKKISVVSNGIDLNIFSIPDNEEKNKQELCRKYGIPMDKKIIMGIASVWETRKGLKQFYELSKVLSEEYQIVLVGLSKQQMRDCPSNIISISRTESRIDLAKIYARSSVLINFSKEESFSLVTIEAMACGTPVIGYGRSAVRELINHNNGEIILSDDVPEIAETVHRVCEKKWIPEVIRETVISFSSDRMGQKIIALYNE